MSLTTGLNLDLLAQIPQQEPDSISTSHILEDVVVTGTMKEVSTINSPVLVEVYRPSFFKKNPSPSIFEAMQNINGVRPQINCNVCNTGDIHINGLEGPYTMVLIDGMPIVSSLSSVYGLAGIPNAIVDRIELVKGPASSLYGSEAVGGLINIITKAPGKSLAASADLMGTSWQEYSADLSLSLPLGPKWQSLSGLSYYNYQQPVDRNQDNFTDVTLQHRISAFQKWSYRRPDHKPASIAGRYLYEDRWGGELNWTPAFRAGDSIYGESIYTKRWELIGKYQLPLREKIVLSASYNDHDQNSVYGTTRYMARQRTGFAQLTWDTHKNRHDWLAGIALRYTDYDDNTPATATKEGANMPQRNWLPGIFVQDEYRIAQQHQLLLGFRLDHHQIHGAIYTPRIAYKWNPGPEHTLRLNAGTGFRVVNLFTEEHAALTGARSLEIRSDLQPERSYNLNLNYNRRLFTTSGHLFRFDLTTFYTYFSNRIIPDYESDPDKIIYDNLHGYAESKGISLNASLNWNNGLQCTGGATLMDNSVQEAGIRKQQILTEHFTATWALSYPIRSLRLSIDYTGNLYSPMRLPLAGPLDPRRAYSPWWSLQNIQFTYTCSKAIELYAGIKNLLNWTPNRKNPFLIARNHDPFDKKVQYDNTGQIIANSENPYALSFDPSYVYAPNQGRRIYLGIRLQR